MGSTRTLLHQKGNAATSLRRRKFREEGERGTGYRQQGRVMHKAERVGLEIGVGLKKAI